jgi:uncharacterized protein YllA (UPF0747 family)
MSRFCFLVSKIVSSKRMLGASSSNQNLYEGISGIPKSLVHANMSNHFQVQPFESMRRGVRSNPKQYRYVLMSADEFLECCKPSSALQENFLDILLLLNISKTKLCVI